uniref:Polypeptide N-acetylgalactosaminyltransferase n=1 Tax=Cavia porcellus TaxID=10141 RepID=H0V3X5_CAVPO
MKLAVKQQANVQDTLKRVKDEVHPAPKTVPHNVVKTKKPQAPKKLFPDSALFQRWGEDLPEAEQRKAQDLFHRFGYNVYLSNQLPLDRSLPDTRDSRCLQKTYPSQLPSLSVILIFMDEALSVIQRAITSIINRTPLWLLKEIILVDDFSSNGELKIPLNEKIEFYNQMYPGLLKIIRHAERKGLAHARNTGWKAASADVVVILDAHVEVNVGWAEPILARIQEDRTVIISPVFDNVRFDTFQLLKYEVAVDGFNWQLWCRYDFVPQTWIDLGDVTAPVRSPSIMGILAANRLFLGEIGALDDGMLVYGGENVELSLRVLKEEPGGRYTLPVLTLAIVTCIALMVSDSDHQNANNIQLAGCWKTLERIFSGDNPQFPHLWSTPSNSGIDYGDISSKRMLQEKLKCKSFDWYLKNVYPVLKPIPIHDIVGYGRMKNSLDKGICLDRGPVTNNIPIMYACHELGSQYVYYRLTGEFYVGSLVAEVHSDDLCLTDPGHREEPTLEQCSKAAQNKLHIYWDFKQGGAMVNRDTHRCLEIRREPSGTYVPVLQTCTAQVWEIQYTLGNLSQTNVL